MFLYKLPTNVLRTAVFLVRTWHKLKLTLDFFMNFKFLVIYYFLASEFFVSAFYFKLAKQVPYNFMWFHFKVKTITAFKWAGTGFFKPLL